MGLCWHVLISCHKAVINTRLKICHFRLTHSYFLCGEDQPTCTSCDAPLTMKHILVDYPDLLDTRQQYFTQSLLLFWKTSLTASSIKTSLISPVLNVIIFFIINCSIRCSYFIVANSLHYIFIAPSLLPTSLYKLMCMCWCAVKKLLTHSLRGDANLHFCSSPWIRVTVTNTDKLHTFLCSFDRQRMDLNSTTST